MREICVGSERHGGLIETSAESERSMGPTTCVDPERHWRQTETNKDPGRPGRLREAFKNLERPQVLTEACIDPGDK